jgi:hypothetical protein
MPISIHNGLPTITITAGSALNQVPLDTLFDTCAALNSGNLAYHLWLAMEHPHIVMEVTFFDDSNPFDPIKLGGALSDPTTYLVTTHGQLTAIIRYHTPYVDSQGHPVVFSVAVALGKDVAVNTILGWPTIISLHMDLQLCEYRVFTHELQSSFPILDCTASCGIPAGAVFDMEAFKHLHSNPIMPMTNHSDHNQPRSKLPSLQCTVIDDTTQGFLICSVTATIPSPAL